LSPELFLTLEIKNFHIAFEQFGIRRRAYLFDINDIPR